MRFLKLAAALFVALAVTACSPSKFLAYDGPEVTRIVVFKGDRKMMLLHHDEVLATHQIDLGFSPEGHKTVEGDGRTPEGRYFIDRRNPNSQFHLSLGISYPHPEDIERARELNARPGGDIFIHGETRRGFLGIFGGTDKDWTAGCIAVTNREMEKIYSMVREGTTIDIYPWSSSEGWTPEPVTSVHQILPPDS
jgi:murein L,D-transpeptidase YafK